MDRAPGLSYVHALLARGPKDRIVARRPPTDSERSGTCPAHYLGGMYEKQEECMSRTRRNE